MKFSKELIIKIELAGAEVSCFTSVLEKVVNVETTIAPNVMKILDEKEIKLLSEILKSLKNE